MEPAMLNLLWLTGCGEVVPPAVCEQGYLAQGLYDPVHDTCQVGALNGCDALETWGGDGCPTFDGYAQALLTPGSPYVEAVCGCVDGSGARYDVIVGYTGYGGDELTFDAGGILRWVKTVSGANADMPTYCCKPEGHRATWLSYGTPVPGLDCTAAVEDTSVGPYDAICDGL